MKKLNSLEQLGSLIPDGFKIKEMYEKIDFEFLQKVTEAKIISN